MTTTSTRKTVGIENAGNGIKVNLGGRTIVEVAIRGDGAADYKVQGREADGSEWLDTGLTYTANANYNDTIEVGWEQLRIECTTGTGGANDSAELTLCAAGK